MTSYIITTFALLFPALISLINPFAGALVFYNMTAHRLPEDRARMAMKISIYSFITLMASLYVGAYVLQFFGISLGALRIAGGVVITVTGWTLLNAPRVNAAEAAAQSGGVDPTFFPLTMPITTGPGTISVAIALGTGRGHGSESGYLFFIGATLAALAISVSIWFAYKNAEYGIRFIGPNGSNIALRLSAFLLMCIGVDILAGGIIDRFSLHL